MFPASLVLDLINAHKLNREDAFDKSLEKLIKYSEAQGRKNVARKLRETRARPSGSFGRLAPASLDTNSVRNERHHAAYLSDSQTSNVVLSAKNRRMVEELILTWKGREALKKSGVDPGLRVLLHGLPGTGKTLLANSLAGELGVPITRVDISRLISSYLGETGRNILEVFEGASGGVIFLDEFEAIAKHRSDDMDVGEAKRVVTAILQALDAADPGTLLIAATNHLELVDTAVRRRFTHEINLDDLDKEARAHVFTMYLRGRRVRNDNIRYLAQFSDSMTAADIKAAVDGSLRKTILQTEGLTFDEYLFTEVVRRAYVKAGFDTKKVEDRKKLVDLFEKLRQVNDKHFTYEEVETITDIPHSTIHHIVTKQA